jgi:hypothetical protein
LNRLQRGERIYHLPFAQPYDTTVVEPAAASSTPPPAPRPKPPDSGARGSGVVERRSYKPRPILALQSAPVSVANLSEHVQEAVAQEREVVAARLEALRAQSARLHELAERVDADVLAAERMLRRMDEMLGLAPQLSLDAQGELRGQKLQEIAVELLREKRGVGVEVHYRDWFELLLGAGMQVGGKDPLATFLTQIGRAPEVESVRPRSGIYRLRAA